MARKSKAQLEAMKPTQGELLADQIYRWRTDIKLFFEEALGCQLSNQQRKACDELLLLIQAKEAIALGRKLKEEYAHYGDKIGISIHSGKGLGKDFWLAGVSLWALICFQTPRFTGLATAPSAPQLEDVYSAEVKRLLRESNAELWRLIEITSKGIYLKTSKSKSKREDSFITKRTAHISGTQDEQATTLQGLHNDFVFVMMDEASGLPEGIYKALEETLTGYMNIAILIGNVNYNTGFFYRTHYDSKDRQFWLTPHWDAEESDLDDIKPGLNNQIARIEKKYGRESNPFRIAVKGLPPLADENSLIPIQWIYDAVERDIEAIDDDPLAIGVDIGRGNDPSIICKRRGNVVWPLKKNMAKDSSIVQDWIEEDIEGYEPDFVGIDSIGLGGPIADNIRRNGFEVTDVNVAERKASDEKYYNLRAEMYWRVREQFENRAISIPNDEELIFELSEIKVEDWEPQLKIKSKKKMKQEGLESPNKADALMLSYYKRPEILEKKTAIDRYRQKLNEKENQTSWMAA
jgi:hypothetical protein